MSDQASNPTNAYTVPSVSITTARTGASSKANELGMRAMQERAYAKRGEPVEQLLKVLRGQYFGWRHKRTLPASTYANGCCQRSHYGFARAHIALQQAVHGHWARQIGCNFVGYAALGGSQVKRQRCQ